MKEAILFKEGNYLNIGFLVIQRLFSPTNYFCSSFCNLIVQTRQLVKVNPFLTNFLILYPLKSPENIGVSDVVRGYKIRTCVNKLTKVLLQSCYL